jgi:hypothetical protein
MTGRRCVTAVRQPRSRSAAADSAQATRSQTAPTAVATAAWSMKKLDRGAVASGARTSSGVRLLAASVMPVSALVKPGPWCTLSTPSSPLTRA